MAVEEGRGEFAPCIFTATPAALKAGFGLGSNRPRPVLNQRLPYVSPAAMTAGNSMSVVSQLSSIMDAKSTPTTM